MLYRIPVALGFYDPILQNRNTVGSRKELGYFIFSSQAKSPPSVLKCRPENLPEFVTRTTAVSRCRSKPVGPNKCRKTVVSVSPSKALKTSSNKTTSRLANTARARA